LRSGLCAPSPPPPIGSSALRGVGGAPADGLELALDTASGSEGPVQAGVAEPNSASSARSASPMSCGVVAAERGGGKSGKARVGSKSRWWW
jgi:hypothetical protein